MYLCNVTLRIRNMDIKEIWQGCYYGTKNDGPVYVVVVSDGTNIFFNERLRSYFGNVNTTNVIEAVRVSDNEHILLKPTDITKWYGRDLKRYYNNQVILLEKITVLIVLLFTLFYNVLID